MKLELSVPLTITVSTENVSLDDMRKAYDLPADASETFVHETVKLQSAHGFVEAIEEILEDYGLEAEIALGEPVLYVRPDDTPEVTAIIDYLTAVDDAVAADKVSA